MARKIKSVEIEELTICDEPANRLKFYIKKHGGLTMEKLLEVLKKILGDEEIDDNSIEKIKGLPEDKVEDIRKALEEIEGFQENFPPALDEAFLSLTKSATYDYPVKESEFDFEDVAKAGASLSKATVAQLKKIQDIIEKLVGEKTEKFNKKDSDGKEIEIPAEIQARLDKLEKLEKAEQERVEKEATVKAEKDKEEKEELLKRVEKLEKTKGTKKSIDGHDKDASDDNDEEDPFPSIPVVR